VLDLIYHQFFFTANSLGRQLTISQFFQPLTLQTLALVAAASHFMLSEYTTGKKVTLMFSEDDYQGKFHPSMVIDCITADAIALITFHMVRLLHNPPSQMLLLHYNRYSLIPVDTPQSLSALLNPCWHSANPVGTPQFPFAVCNPHWLSSIPIGAPQSPPCSAVWIGALIFHSVLCTAFSICATPVGWPRLNRLLDFD